MRIPTIKERRVASDVVKLVGAQYTSQSRPCLYIVFAYQQNLDTPSPTCTVGIRKCSLHAYSRGGSRPRSGMCRSTTVVIVDHHHSLGSGRQSPWRDSGSPLSPPTLFQIVVLSLVTCVSHSQPTTVAKGSKKGRRALFSCFVAGGASPTVLGRPTSARRRSDRASVEDG